MIKISRNEYDKLRLNHGFDPITNHREGRFTTTWQKPLVHHLEFTRWKWLVSYPENFKLGKYTDIGALCYFQAKKGITIGNHVQIGSHCSVYSVDSEREIEGEIIIEDNVKIGTHTTIMPNTIIRSGAKIPMYSKLDGGEYT